MDEPSQQKNNGFQGNQANDDSNKISQPKTVTQGETVGQINVPLMSNSVNYQPKSFSNQIQKPPTQIQANIQNRVNIQPIQRGPGVYPHMENQNMNSQRLPNRFIQAQQNRAPPRTINPSQVPPRTHTEEEKKRYVEEQRRRFAQLTPEQKKLYMLKIQKWKKDQLAKKQQLQMRMQQQRQQQQRRQQQQQPQNLIRGRIIPAVNPGQANQMYAAYNYGNRPPPPPGQNHFSGFRPRANMYARIPGQGARISTSQGLQTGPVMTTIQYNANQLRLVQPQRHRFTNQQRPAYQQQRRRRNGQFGSDDEDDYDDEEMNNFIVPDDEDLEKEIENQEEIEEEEEYVFDDSDEEDEEDFQVEASQISKRTRSKSSAEKMVDDYALAPRRSKRHVKKPKRDEYVKDFEELDDEEEKKSKNNKTVPIQMTLIKKKEGLRIEMIVHHRWRRENRVEGRYLIDDDDETEGENEETGIREYLLKWQGWAHIHNTWNTEEEVRGKVKGYKKLVNYIKNIEKEKEKMKGLEKSEIEQINLDKELDLEIRANYILVDRIIHKRVVKEVVRDEPSALPANGFIPPSGSLGSPRRFSLPAESIFGDRAEIEMNFLIEKEKRKGTYEEDEDYVPTNANASHNYFMSDEEDEGEDEGEDNNNNNNDGDEKKEKKSEAKDEENEKKMSDDKDDDKEKSNGNIENGKESGIKVRMSDENDGIKVGVKMKEEKEEIPQVEQEEKKEEMKDEETTEEEPQTQKRLEEDKKEEDSPNTVDVVYYLVKWKFLPYEECTWEKESVMKEKFQENIDEYERLAKIRAYDYPEIYRDENFIELDEQPAHLGKGLKLRDYQLIGVNWLYHSWCNGRNVILADEMGLGKTIQTISFLSFLKNEGRIPGPFLVIVPLSTISSWVDEFARWAPDMYVVNYIGGDKSRRVIRAYELFERDEHGNSRTRFNVLLTTREMILKDYKLLKPLRYSYLVVDEAHLLKRSENKLYNVLIDFETAGRLFLTGTPLQNTIKELWALLHFLQPVKFGSYESFHKEYNVDRLKDKKVLDNLHSKLQHHILRRMKKDVEKSLPQKVERIIRVELTPIQTEYYRGILSRSFAQLTGGKVKGLLNIVVQLKKCCNHPFVFDGARETIIKKLKEKSGGEDFSKLDMLVRTSGKLILLDKLLPRLKQDGHRVLIFSQMVTTLDILGEYLRIKGYFYQRLDGNTTARKRKQSIDHFNAEDSQDFVFILSTRAGGLGINLATADTVIIFDSDWNPQNDLQAESRAHRIGQKKVVNIYRLITADTVEEKIIETAKKKMVLEHLVIQKMDMNGYVESGFSKSNKPSYTKEDIQAILRFGAQNLFEKEDRRKRREKKKLKKKKKMKDENEKEESSEDESEDSEVYDEDDEENEEDLNKLRIDDILSRAEVVENKDSGDNDLLSAFKVANFTIMPSATSRNNRGGKRKSRMKQLDMELSDADILDPFWAQLFPESASQFSQQQLSNQYGWRKTRNNKYDTASGMLQARKKKRGVEIKGVNAKQSAIFIRSFKKFADLSRLDDILKDCGEKEGIQSIPKEKWKEVAEKLVKACEDAVKDEEPTPGTENRRSAGKKIPFNGVQRVNATIIVRRMKQISALKEIITKYLKTYGREQSNTKMIKKWPVHWTLKDDYNLLRGILKYGISNWEKIRMDSRYQFQERICPEFSQEYRNRLQKRDLLRRTEQLLVDVWYESTFEGEGQSDEESQKVKRKGKKRKGKKKAKRKKKAKGKRKDMNDEDDENDGDEDEDEEETGKRRKRKSKRKKKKQLSLSVNIKTKKKSPFVLNLSTQPRMTRAQRKKLKEITDGTIEGKSKENEETKSEMMDEEKEDEKEWVDSENEKIDNGDEEGQYSGEESDDEEETSSDEEDEQPKKRVMKFTPEALLEEVSPAFRKLRNIEKIRSVPKRIRKTKTYLHIIGRGIEHVIRKQMKRRGKNIALLEQNLWKYADSKCENKRGYTLRILYEKILEMKLGKEEYEIQKEKRENMIRKYEEEMKLRRERSVTATPSTPVDVGEDLNFILGEDDDEDNGGGRKMKDEEKGKALLPVGSKRKHEDVENDGDDEEEDLQPPSKKRKLNDDGEN